MMQPFLIALQFLTRIPVRLEAVPDNKTIGYSVVCYPLVGLIVGVFLGGFAWLLSDAPPLVAAALLVTLWVFVTGGLHLDGLADSADAWVGGMGNRDKTLAIMKDPNCGPAGVTSIVLVLSLKLAALHALLSVDDWIAMMLAAVLARTLLPLLFLTTPYVREGGLGSVLAGNLPRRACFFSIAAVPLCMLLLPDVRYFALLPVALAVFLALRNQMMKRIGGTTGDTAGALVEIAETAAVLTAAVIMN